MASLILGCASEVEQTKGIDLQLMDKNVSPGEDFFSYVNGSWYKDAEIPDDRTRWGSFDELREMTSNDMMSIVTKASQELKKTLDNNYENLSDQQKAVQLFELITDTLSRDQNGIAPLKPFLEKIENIQNLSDLQDYLAAMEPYGGGGFLSFGVSPDSKDSNKKITYLGPGSLGLSDRDYYLSDDEGSKKVKEQYKTHVERMLLIVDPNAENAGDQAANIVALETKMAAAKLDKVSRRDPNKTYNPTAIEDLQKMTKTIDWKRFFSQIGIEKETFNVSDVGYFSALDQILNSNALTDLKSYLRWTLINRSASYLTQEMEQADWEFYSKILRGAKTQRPLDKRALQTVDWTLGEALGKLYVAEKFPPEAKTQMEEMVANLIEAYTIRIQKLDWMDEATKKKAIEKLEKMTIKVGYPDQWKDYGGLNLNPGQDATYFDAMMAISAFNFYDDLKKLDMPVDKTEWFMPPQTVNAYYNPLYNEIVFPAAILQPPFFNFNADAAVNYGGIGAVIGHEISHGFDDSGADYDADGSLVNWWTDKDLKQFDDLGQKLADQYSAIAVLPDVYINGKFTLGENIGDLGGVNAAYDALKLHHEKNGTPEPIDGFTSEQRFFISWATVWRTKIRDEALKNQVRVDPHAPGRQRAVQTLRNIDAFYQAFNIKEQDSVYLAPEQRVYIW